MFPFWLYLSVLSEKHVYILHDDIIYHMVVGCERTRPQIPYQSSFAYPNEIANRLKTLVPPRQRNRFISELVEKAVSEHEGKLAAIADAVTAEDRESEAISSELAAWEKTTVSDGLNGPV